MDRRYIWWWHFSFIHEHWHSTCVTYWSLREHASTQPNIIAKEQEKFQNLPPLRAGGCARCVLFQRLDAEVPVTFYRLLYYPTLTMESSDGRKSKLEVVAAVGKSPNEEEQQQEDPKPQGASQTSAAVSLEEDYHNHEASQVTWTLSQADEVIQKLDKEGELTEVAGSQSMLSQELLCMSQRESDDDEYAHHPSSLVPVPCSQQTETSISMAQRLGVLTQETLDGDHPQSPGRSPSSLQAQAQAHAKDSMGVEAPTTTPIQHSLVAVENYVSPPSHQGFQGFHLLASQQEGEDQDEGMEDIPLSQDPVIKANLKGPLPPKLIPVPTKKLFGDVLGTPTPKRTMLSPIRETPVRNCEVFGSLLDAVQVITEQEEVNAKLYALQHACSQDTSSIHNAQQASTGNKRQSPTGNPSEEKPIKKKRTTTASSKRKETENKAQQAAKRAAALAEQTVADPEMAKKLLLSMALVRENPRMAPSSWPPKGAVVPEGFFWAHYPPLEGG